MCGAGDGEHWSGQQLQDQTGTALLQPPGSSPREREEFDNVLRYGPIERILQKSVGLLINH